MHLHLPVRGVHLNFCSASVFPPSVTHNGAGVVAYGGKVYVWGGYSGNLGDRTLTTEIYDPATGATRLTGTVSSWRNSRGAAKKQRYSTMTAARSDHTATTLLDGRVLIAGGNPAGTAEIFDPVTEAFTAIGSLAYPRIGHSATLFADGSVLLAGGGSATAEFFDPNTLTFTLVAQPMVASRKTFNGAKYYRCDIQQNQRHDKHGKYVTAFEIE